MNEKTRGLLASYQWLLDIYQHVMTTFIKYMPCTFKSVHAISCVAITYKLTHI
jgi:hypothetical protein